uniref:Penicillin-binding protein 3 n=1 Tax=Chlorobium chlorochromatii (strain CaD3) TaxID=340177 RepID=Q3ANV9_CHLCH
MTNPEFRNRLGIVIGGFAVFIIIIIAMLLNIQVINVEKYKKKAERQYVKQVTEYARRGAILDRRSRVLAESVESITFYASPKQISKSLLFDEEGEAVINKRNNKQQTFDNTQGVATLFAKHLGANRQIYLKALKKRKGVAVLAKKVPIEKALPLITEIKSRKMHGIWHEKEQQRSYLNVAAQLIGMTGNEKSSVDGGSGLELQLNKELKGVNGKRYYQRHATGELYTAPDVAQKAPKSGNSVQLTIDSDIQSIVEDELSKAVAEFQADAATGVVMDVRTGEILAMASSPTFDLNRRSTWTQDNSRNRAVTEMFEPGSTFKLVMAAAATEVLHRKSSDYVYAHNGVMPYYKLKIRDHEPYGTITFKEALMHSSNIVAATTAMKLGRETFYAYTKNFGFGQKTGVGLVGEARGIVRPLEKWDSTTLPWMGYGYQVMVTPLQILQAYATVANDGELMRPYIIKKVVSPEGKVIRETAPEVVRRVLKPETARYVSREYFKAIVDSGTAKNPILQSLHAAGKTGTARRASAGSYAVRSYVSSFVGYFPVSSPRYAMIILVETPRTSYYAAAVAVPVFARIASRMVACSQEMQKMLAIRSPEQELIDSLATVTVPDLRGLKGREAQRMLSWLGLTMEHSGDFNGVVVSQSVSSGTQVAKAKTVVVRLSK